MEFTEDEVREELHKLGYANVSRSKLKLFMSELAELVEEEQSVEDINLTNEHHAFCKEKVYDHGASFNNTSELFSSMASTSDTEYEKQGFSGEPDVYSHKSMRRKVARKKNGAVHVFDETFTDTESAMSDITGLEDRLRSLPFENHNDMLDVSTSNEKWEGASSISHGSVNSLPAFIRPSTTHPHTKKIRKCDPVSRYHQFKQEWIHNKVPGEKKHSSLRWNVRERMLHCEIFVKPRQRYVPNNYIVPTEKKRQALRWQVRSALAHV